MIRGEVHPGHERAPEGRREFRLVDLRGEAGDGAGEFRDGGMAAVISPMKPKSFASSAVNHVSSSIFSSTSSVVLPVFSTYVACAEELQPSAAAEAIPGDMAQRIRAMLETLPVAERKTVELGFYGGLSHCAAVDFFSSASTSARRSARISSRTSSNG